MNRRDIISQLFDHQGYTSYLELGLRDYNSVFNHIKCDVKHSVDLNMESAHYTMSTDDFFYKLESGMLDLDKDFKWDVIFVDANHLADFVKNDTLNSINHLNDNGMIFLHDTLPPNYDAQLENKQCQTAWKVVPYFLKYHPEIHICTTTESDGGLGIIIKNKSKERPLLNSSFNIFSEYYLMDADRNTSQNFIELDKVYEWVQNPYYNFKEQNLSHYTNPKDIQHVWI